ncbi:MAG: hypothetical protein PHV93_01495 [Candidatus Pacebacteria bacterium]|nr:hypothetical protein [Candidatus Paceibacterota bacterium]
MNSAPTPRSTSALPPPEKSLFAGLSRAGFFQMEKGFSGGVPVKTGRRNSIRNLGLILSYLTFCGTCPSGSPLGIRLGHFR